MANSAGPGDDDLLAAEPCEPAADPVRARKKAMDFLARRDYGFEELVGRLKAAGFDPETARDSVAKLAGEGLQDDARFAAAFVRSKAGRGTGPLRIRQALREKGLRDAVVDAALDSADTDWYRRAREVRERKFGSARPADFKEKARQMRFLQYRGFEQDHIGAAFDAPE